MTTPPAVHSLDGQPSKGKLATWPSRIASAITLGFFAAVLMWVGWFLLHMPATIDLVPQAVSGPALLAVACAALFFGLVRIPKGDRVVVGCLAGLTAGLVNLLTLGTRLTEATAHLTEAAAKGEAATKANDLVPNAGIVVVGFMVAMLAAGLVAGFGAAGLGGAGERRSPRSWLGSFAWVNTFAILPLLTLGGLVTSARAGFAVPDWPGTYGANMFLYPISLMSDPRVFLEHTHRLFGAMVGVTTIAGLIFALALGPKDWRKGAVAALIGGAAGLGLALVWQPTAAMCVLCAFSGAFFGLAVGIAWTSKVWFKWAALGLFILVCAQGVAGGVWTQEKARGLVILHAVTGQVYFALTCAYAAAVSERWGRWRADIAARASAVTPRTGTIVLLFLLFVQLVMGTMVRHPGAKGGNHALYTHIGLSMVIVLLVMIVGTKMMRLKQMPVHGKSLWWAGHAPLIVVAVQFVLGWVAFMVWKSSPSAAAPLSTELATAGAIKPVDVLIRTAHQANGALLLGTSAVMAVWGLARRRA